jgi:hypothetical protein
LAYKILGQVRPSTTSNADLYTVPSGFQTVVSTLHLNNTASVSSRVSIFVRQNNSPLDAASADNEFVTQVLVSPGQPLSFTVGITLAEGDTITVSSEIENTVTFHAFGSESE